MRTLIAEDDELLRALLEDFLTGLGHEVKSAVNGVDLVRLALRERPELVITDLNMPGMDGGSMVAMMDMYPDLEGIPVIIITGATEADLKRAGLPREIPVLAKPFDFDRIAAEIERVEHRRRFN
ncbi:MAG: hypothetical protein A2X31_06975 [Elusimicrobia bacterium GWB2_63_22]|nr:MAG: hypothetical protein A2X31_06975 [Elusimicrobia bacterium GWB2_63_22]